MEVFMDDAEELFDVVDEDDKVIGQASRRDVHEKSLLHRAVHILVFNPDGDLFLQKRSMSKDENPGLWDTSAAGHVGAGEDYHQTAQRELEEELGISESLKLYTSIKACPETLWEHIRIYTCETRKIISINTEEIDEGKFCEMGRISSALRKERHRFTSTFNLIFNLLNSSKRGF